MKKVIIGEHRIYRGDCLEILPLLNKKVTLILADPPYGTTPLAWDKELDFAQMWKTLKVCLPKVPALLFGQEPFSSKLRISNLRNYKYDWYWQKERLTNVFQVKRRPGKVIETISMFNNTPIYNAQKMKHKGKLVSNGDAKNAKFSKTQNSSNSVKPIAYQDDGYRYPIQIIKIKRDKRKNKKLHPTQKPVALLEYLIKTYTNEGDTVLDFCMGSGSTGVACINTGRRFIGIEKDKEYFKIARTRLKEAYETERAQS